MSATIEQTENAATDDLTEYQGTFGVQIRVKASSRHDAWSKLYRLVDHLENAPDVVNIDEWRVPLVRDMDAEKRTDDEQRYRISVALTVQAPSAGTAACAAAEFARDAMELTADRAFSTARSAVKSYETEIRWEKEDIESLADWNIPDDRKAAYRASYEDNLARSEAALKKAMDAFEQAKAMRSQMTQGTIIDYDFYDAVPL